MKLKVGIICAGDRELEPFLPYINNCKTSEKAMLKFYDGVIENVEIVTLFCGVCKVNAAIATQILIDTFHVNVVINAGTAGGMDKRLKIFDTVISTEVAYCDVDEGILTQFHPWMKTIYFKADNKLLELSKKVLKDKQGENKIYWGRMITGETFIKEENREEANAKYNPLSVDMETASVAHVCYVNNVPFIAIRSITDTADHSGIGEFEKNCVEASEISMEIVACILKEMSNSR